VNAATLAGCAQPLSVAYDTALLDLDGVVYIGETAVPRAAAALEVARSHHMKIAFVTNNASRTPAVIATHLTELGVPAQPAEVVTSSMAAARVLLGLVPTGAKVLVIGGTGLQVAVREQGFTDTDEDSDDVAAVVQGYGPDLTWAHLAEGALAVQRGVPWVATNLDSTLPSPRGLLPGNGALVAAITAATGRTPVSAGKPELPLQEEAVRRSGARTPLVVGDRLDTDIEGAVRAGCPSLLVLTGVTDAAQLLAASPERRPTYIAADLDGLNSLHPEVVVTHTTATCAGWRAERAADSVTIEQVEETPGDAIDALRAAASVAWLSDSPIAQVRGDADALRALGLG
jgi:glycerol 3-phosphatase-2